MIVAIAAWSGSLTHSTASFVIAGVAAAIAIRTLCERMFLNHTTLKFRNLLRTYRIELDEIKHIAYSDRPFYWAGKGIGARRHRIVVTTLRGRDISIAATQSVRGGLLSERYFGEPPTKRWYSTLSALTSSKSEG